MKPPGGGLEHWELDGAIHHFVRSSSDFPQYAYGLVQAANLAARLGVARVAGLELGVAGGNGLVELERLAAAIGDASAVSIEVAGFDLGSGMPEPVDHRDMPYIWQPRFFTMDESKIRSRLDRARLVLGDIADTGREFVSDEENAPIGFISFDLDYYSSTVAALTALLGAPAERFLPRVLCYFDDTVGPHDEFHSAFTGELLAINEFNDHHDYRKLGKVNGLAWKLPYVTEPWVEGIYVLHLFDHPRYNEYVFAAPDRQFPLEDPDRRSS